MTDQFQERRRTPRISIDRPHELRLGRRIRVKVVDISAGGALLWTDEQLSVGTQGRLNVVLEGTPVDAQVQIRREGPAADGSGRLIGAALGKLQPGQQRALEQFLRRAGTDPTMD